MSPVPQRPALEKLLPRPVPAAVTLDPCVMCCRALYKFQLVGSSGIAQTMWIANCHLHHLRLDLAIARWLMLPGIPSKLANTLGGFYDTYLGQGFCRESIDIAHEFQCDLEQYLGYRNNARAQI
ncbi:hypothetical protein U9M48_005760 [Paspalum notatum var. saurae]|uniref:Uncharacterized protein n=1 Tax=Paspalum notatum var. saurae TaxID=547442 RepID=A0AAQ3PSX5_PASNO